MPIELVPADHALAEAAGEFKAAHKVSLADAFAAALAAQRNAELVTGATELKALDGTIKLRWLG
ncbi:MAG TPA: PIN domain-containing protein [Planctomycetota bacterium]|nr:PIN domain-containing protein [Planctomycetota bacterium]